MANYVCMYVKTIKKQKLFLLIFEKRQHIEGNDTNTKNDIKKFYRLCFFFFFFFCMIYIQYG